MLKVWILGEEEVGEEEDRVRKRRPERIEEERSKDGRIDG